MAKKNKLLYPGIEQAEKEKSKVKQFSGIDNSKPDFIGMAPNYDKFKSWDPEKVLVYLNID